MSTTATDSSLLHTAGALKECSLCARDGEIGHVQDLCLDHRQWQIRYFVVTTGGWLSRRRVLIAPVAVRTPDWTMRQLPVKLTQEQVRKSPPLGGERPIRREEETALHKHYGWPLYWDTLYTTAVLPVPPPLPMQESAGAGSAPKETQDPRFRRLSELLRDRIIALDGEIGHVEDVLLDPRTWTLRYLVVSTRNWWPGRQVLISPAWVDPTTGSGSPLLTSLTRDAIRESPAYNPAEPLSVDQAGHLHDYYGRPRYADWEAEPGLVSHK